MECTKTDRGFARIDATDGAGREWSVQESSSAEPHLWLGVNRPVLKAGPPWREVALPADVVLVDSLAHLSVKDVRALVFALNQWLSTGRLPDCLPGMPRPVEEKHYLIVSRYVEAPIGCTWGEHGKTDVLTEEPGVTFREQDPATCPVCEESR